MKSDHILFIASGAFHVSKPSDLLPELQGRLPIRVELQPLDVEDFRRILTETEASLVKQSVAMLATEGVEIAFGDDAILRLAEVAVDVNTTVENIGARRLQTVMERVLDDISFTAPDRGGERIAIDRAYVDERVGALSKNADLSASSCSPFQSCRRAFRLGRDDPDRRTCGGPVHAPRPQFADCRRRDRAVARSGLHPRHPDCALARRRADCGCVSGGVSPAEHVPPRAERGRAQCTLRAGLSRGQGRAR